MRTRYQEKVEQNKLRAQLKELGCPYWPTPNDPRAIAWLEGNQATASWAREQVSA